MKKTICNQCISCINGYCIEKNKSIKEVKECNEFINKETADFLCDLMCSNCEE